MYDNDTMTQRETELLAQVAAMEKDRHTPTVTYWMNVATQMQQESKRRFDDWFVLAEERDVLKRQVAALQARMTPIIEALESLCHAVERGDTDFDYLQQLALDGRWAITPPKEEL